MKRSSISGNTRKSNASLNLCALALVGALVLMVVPRAANSSRTSSSPAGSPAVGAPQDSAIKSASQSHDQPTFADDIAPIIYQHCAACHYSSTPNALCGANPLPLLSYDEVKGSAAAIATVTRSRFMPPWLPEAGYGDFADTSRLSDAQIRLIAEWVRDGAPEGAAAEVQPTPSFTGEWQLGKPDMVLEAAQPLSVPATGPDVFWNFIFSPSIKTTRYVRAIEVRPGNDPSLIHHANVILDPARSGLRQEVQPGAGFPGMDLALEQSPLYVPSHFLFWKPGSAPRVEPDGMAWRLDPGTDLVLNAHFMPMGTTEHVKPSIGLYFTDMPPNRFPMLIELENDDALDIPPGARDFKVSDDFRLPRDVDVLAVYPHAHYLGHVLEGYATLPDGQRKWLIRIPNWNPNWQGVYQYRSPVFLPKGSLISMRYSYDNSSTNPRNPHTPPQRVVGGNQSTDEMAHLWFQVLPRGAGDGRIEIEMALLEHRVEKYHDDFPARLQLGAMMLSRLNPAGAVALLEQAVHLDPKQEEARRFLGMALEGVGRSHEAIEQFQIATELKPDDTQARYGLARALVRSGKLAEGIENFRKVAEADPRNTELRDEFGEFLMQQGKPAEALVQFNAALGVDPAEKTALHDRDLALKQLQAQ